MAFPICKVTGVLLNPSGAPIVNAIVAAELSEYIVYNEYIVPHKIVTRTDYNGEFSLDLFPNPLVINPQTYYKVTIATNQDLIDMFEIIVPVSQTANLFKLKTKEIPAGTEDDIAKMLAHLNEIEANVKADAGQIHSEVTEVQTLGQEVKAIGQLVTTASGHVDKLAQEILSDKAAIEQSKQDAENAANTAKSVQSQISHESSNAKSSADSAKQSALEAAVSASDAATHESDTEALRTNAAQIESRINVIYQQILAAVSAHGGGGTAVAHLVIKDSYSFKATQGQTEVSGADISGVVLSTSPGLNLVMRNGLALSSDLSYDDSVPGVIRFHDPLNADDIVIVVAFTQATGDGSGSGGGTIGLPIRIEDVSGLSAVLASKYSSTNQPVISDITGLNAILAKVYSTDNPPSLDDIAGLSAAIAKMYSADNPPTLKDIIGLVHELSGKYSDSNIPDIDHVTNLRTYLSWKFGIDNPLRVGDIPELPISKTTGLQEELDKLAAGSEGGGGGAINLPIGIDDVTDLSNQLASKYSATNKPGVPDILDLDTSLNKKFGTDNPLSSGDVPSVSISKVRGLQEELESKFSLTNKPEIDDIVNLRVFLGIKFGTDNPLRVDDIPSLPISKISGLQKELLTFFSLDNPITANDVPELPISKTTGLQAELDKTFSTDNPITVNDVPELPIAKTKGLQAELDKAYSSDNPLTVDDIPLLPISRTSGLQAELDKLAAPGGGGGSGAGGGGGVALPISIGDVTDLDAQLASKYSATNKPHVTDIIGLGTELDKKFGEDNPITAGDVPSLSISKTTGLRTELDKKFGVDKHITAADVPVLPVSKISGLQGELDKKFSGDNPLKFTDIPELPISKTVGLQAALDSKYSATNKPGVPDILDLDTSLNKKFGSDNPLTVGDVPLISISKTIGLRTELDKKFGVDNHIKVEDVPELPISKTAGLQAELDKLAAGGGGGGVNLPIEISDVNNLQSSLNNKFGTDNPLKTTDIPDLPVNKIQWLETEGNAISATNMVLRYNPGTGGILESLGNAANRAFIEINKNVENTANIEIQLNNVLPQITGVLPLINNITPPDLSLMGFNENGAAIGWADQKSVRNRYEWVFYQDDNEHHIAQPYWGYAIFLREEYLLRYSHEFKFTLISTGQDGTDQNGGAGSDVVIHKHVRERVAAVPNPDSPPIKILEFQLTGDVVPLTIHELDKYPVNKSLETSTGSPNYADATHTSVIIPCYGGNYVGDRDSVLPVYNTYRIPGGAAVPPEESWGRCGSGGGGAGGISGFGSTTAHGGMGGWGYGGGGGGGGDTAGSDPQGLCGYSSLLEYAQPSVIAATKAPIGNGCSGMFGGGGGGAGRSGTAGKGGKAIVIMEVKRF